jgi:hypothetical protein
MKEVNKNRKLKQAGKMKKEPSRDGIQKCGNNAGSRKHGYSLMRLIRSSVFEINISPYDK